MLVTKSLGVSIPKINGGGQPGLDHCFVMDSSNGIAHVGTLTHGSSGRRMKVFASQVCMNK